MDNKVIKKLMMGFSQEQLKGYLDRDILESLLEWNSDEGVYTKTKLIEMILTIKGVSTLLKDKNFRRELLKRFDTNLIEEYRCFFQDEIKGKDDLEKIIEMIISHPWKESDIVTEIFLGHIGYKPEDIFDNSKKEEKAISQLHSYGKFYELLDYQYIIRQKVLTKLNSDEDLVRLLIHMPTGTGKTKTAMHIISNYYSYSLNKKGLILWIAHTKELLDQAYETFCNVWSYIGNGETNIYRNYDIFDVSNETEFNGIMICSIQKLTMIFQSNKDLYNTIKRDLKLIVYDEAHKAAAEKSKITIEDLMTRKDGLLDRSLIGLSATPGRTSLDSFDNKLLSSMFGDCLISIDTKLMNEVNYSRSYAINMEVPKDIIKYFQDRKVLSNVMKEEITYNNDISADDMKKMRIVTNRNGYDDFSEESLKVIAHSKNRNLKILQKLYDLNNKDIPTIVFACSVKHAQLLSAMLSVQGVKNVCVFGNMPANERKASIEKFKNKDDDCNIIINYEVLTTGFDSTNIECVFITRPTQSVVLYSQMLGRGLRGPKMGGNETCLLIDIKDNLTKYNEHLAFSYFNNYWGGR